MSAQARPRGRSHKGGIKTTRAGAGLPVILLTGRTAVTADVRTPATGVEVQQLPLVTYVSAFDDPGTVEYISPPIEALLGFPAGSWLADPDFCLSRIVADDRATVDAASAAVRHTREPVTVEYRLRAEDDRLVWVRDVCMIVVAADGSMTVQGFLTDITHEKELELALARERAQTDGFFRDSSVGMAITDADGRFVRVNEALARMNSMSVEQHVGLRLRDFAPEIADGVEPLLEEVWRTGKPVQGRELSVERAPGEIFDSVVSYFPVDAAGAKQFGGIVIDVTELHRSMDKRDAAERDYRRLVEQLPLVTYVNAIGPDSHVTYISPQVEQLFGYALQEWLADGGLWERVVHPDDVKAVREQHALARANGGSVECEYRVVRTDGTIRWVLDLLLTELDDTGTPLFEQGFVIDITDRKRAELAARQAADALRTSEEKFRAVFDNALDAMVVADDEGRYVDANPAACALFGRTREDLLELTVDDVVQPTGGTGEFTITRSDGTLRETEGSATANVRPGHHLSILRDVTERKQLERALWQAQKLESVGTLAGGVAHDFNNMLTAISGYSQLLLARLAPGSVEREHAEEIDRAASRAAKLTAQLLAFGRRQVLQPQALDLNALVTVLMTMLARVVGPEVELDFAPDDELQLVRADPAQMEQVILNVAANAAEAMPAGGRVQIGTRNLVVGPDAGSGSLAAGAYVELSIGDSGPGMDAETLGHVFEPFFTTKEVGAGDGLGLSTAYGIVTQSGGTIVAESAPGAGAIFRVYLPVAPDAHDLNGGHEGRSLR